MFLIKAIILIYVLTYEDSNKNPDDSRFELYYIVLSHMGHHGFSTDNLYKLNTIMSVGRLSDLFFLKKKD